MSEGWQQPAPVGWKQLADEELIKDIGYGDISGAFFPSEQMSSFRIEAESKGILCGIGIAAYVLQQTDPRTEISVHFPDGTLLERGKVVLSGRAPTAALLRHERTALNFLMHLSGVASLTHRMVCAVEGRRTRIVDTRKTLPGLRHLQKYAVRCGGGQNHRFALYDGLMLKDNHILAAGSVQVAVEQARRFAGHMTRIEVECTSLSMVEQAVQAGADIVMLDNMSLQEMTEAARQYGHAVTLEASGGVTLDSVGQVAATGVHAISVGALTHSAPATSFHLEFLT